MVCQARTHWGDVKNPDMDGQALVCHLEGALHNSALLKILMECWSNGVLENGWDVLTVNGLHENRKLEFRCQVSGMKSESLPDT